MPSPTFVNNSVTAFNSTGLSKTLGITSQAGDLLVVYAGADTDGASNAITINTPSGNGVTFNSVQSSATSNAASAYLWAGTDTTGGTNWTLTCTASLNTASWGFGCAVFRSTGGIGASNVARTSGAPTLNLTTQQSNSAIVVFNNDWAALDGTSRTWQTVNSITPTAGNGLELKYEAVSGLITVYSAYYNDAGTAGTVTVGLSSPTGQTYTIVAAEVMGAATPQPGIATAWLTA